MPQRILFFAVFGAIVAFAQATSPTPNSSQGLDLLTRVSNKYKEARSYYIESTEEQTSIGENRHYWERTVLIAAGSPENHYHYEGRSQFGNAVRVSDGNTVWTYHVTEQLYTAQPASAEQSDKHRIIPMAEQALLQAQNLRQRLGTLGKSFNSAELLSNARIKLNGHKFSCYVVRLRSADEKRPSPNFSFERTIWIDKNNLTVLRIVEHAQVSPGSGSAGPMNRDSVTTFSNTKLDSPVPENLFHFVPPPEARLLDEFPDPRTSFGPNLIGQQAPSIKLKSADGQIRSLDSFRGKPVLIDLWATWCAPCVEALPKFDKLYHEIAGKDLVLISVDRDEEAKTASAFLAKKGYTWPNFHDDGEVEKLVGSSGIPRTLLIDAQGKVLYDATAVDDDILRTQIAKLGLEYTPLAAKKESPCPASN